VVIQKTQSALDQGDLFTPGVIRYHVRATNNDEDTLLSFYVQAAMDYCISRTNRNIGNNAFVVMLHKSEAYSPIYFRGITGMDTATPGLQGAANDFTIKYLNKSGSYVDVPAANYRTQSDVYPCLLEFIDWNPSDISEQDKYIYKITFTAGEALSDVPRAFKQAVLLLVGHFYNQREGEIIGAISGEIKFGIERLLDSIRKF
jgi:hypothetical protein